MLTTDGVEKLELTLPRLSLEEAGADTVLVVPKPHVQSMKHNETDDRFAADMLLIGAQPDEFDAVMLPGGALCADVLRKDTKRQGLLVSAKLVKGRRLTSYYTLQDAIRRAGGEWEDQEVVVDRNWVTSRKPETSRRSTARCARSSRRPNPSP